MAGKRARGLVVLGWALLVGSTGLAAPPDRLVRGAVEVRWSASGRLGVSWRGQPIVQYEELQLIDRRKGWRSVFAYGASKAVQAKVDAEKGAATFAESAAGRLSCTKQLTVAAGEAAWDVACEVAKDTGATDHFYFLDIPQAVLAGACYVARTTASRQVHGEMGEGGAGTVLAGIHSIVFLTPERRIHFELGGEGTEWLLTDWTASVHKSYRLRIERRVTGEPFKTRMRVRLRVGPCTPQEVAAARQQAREAAAARRRQRLVRRGFLCDKPLRLGAVAASAGQVGRHAKLELTFDLDGRFDNPFDPDQIDVAAEFRSPSGTRIVMPAFLYQEFRRGEAGVERAGSPVWKVRFAPVEPGRYTYRIVAKNRGKEAASPEGSVTCTPRKTRGMLRVCKANGRHYQFDSGEPYFPSGINLFVATRLGSPIPADRLDLCERWMTRLAAHEGNFVRLRMDSWWLAIEMTPDDAAGYLGLGTYHQQSCWEVDRIYDMAQRLGIYVMHCLDNANGSVNASKHSWRLPYNLYLTRNGGVCERAEDFWAHPEARRWVRHKLRYCVARWGYHPHLMCWEFWNEVSCRAATIDAAAAWHRDMARALRALDPYDHPITTSLMGDRRLYAKIWELPEMEIVQHHHYGNAELAPAIMRMTREAVERYRKPFFLGEYGIGRGFKPPAFAYDEHGVHLHNGMWATTFALGSGAGAFWYVKGCLDDRLLYGHYRGLARFARRVPWASAELRPCKVDPPTFPAPPAKLHYRELAIPTSSRFAFERPPHTDFTVQPDGSITNADSLRGMLHCAKGRKAPPTFHVTLDKPGQLLIHVHRSVGDGTNKLLVWLDGKRVVDQAFPAGKEADPKSEYVEQYDNWRTPYDKTVTIAVPAGRHAIRPEAVGKDRLEVSYLLKGVVAFERTGPLRAHGLRTDKAAWLWLQNRTSHWRTAYAKKQPIAVEGMATRLRGLPDGRYRIEWWDTWEGRAASTAQAESKGGVLPLSIPKVARDIACLIEPQ